MNNSSLKIKESIENLRNELRSFRLLQNKDPKSIGEISFFKDHKFDENYKIIFGWYAGFKIKLDSGGMMEGAGCFVSFDDLNNCEKEIKELFLYDTGKTKLAKYLLSEIDSL